METVLIKAKHLFQNKSNYKDLSYQAFYLYKITVSKMFSNVGARIETDHRIECRNRFKYKWNSVYDLKGHVKYIRNWLNYGMSISNTMEYNGILYNY